METKAPGRSAPPPSGNSSVPPVPSAYSCAPREAPAHPPRAQVARPWLAHPQRQAPHGHLQAAVEELHRHAPIHVDAAPAERLRGERKLQVLQQPAQRTHPTPPPPRRSEKPSGKGASTSGSAGGPPPGSAPARSPGRSTPGESPRAAAAPPAAASCPGWATPHPRQPPPPRPTRHPHPAGRPSQQARAPRSPDAPPPPPSRPGAPASPEARIRRPCPSHARRTAPACSARAACGLAEEEVLQSSADLRAQRDARPARPRRRPPRRGAPACR